MERTKLSEIDFVYRMLKSLGEVKYLTDSQCDWVYTHISRSAEHEGPKENVLEKFKSTLKILWP